MKQDVFQNKKMTKNHLVTVDGNRFLGQRNTLLLEAALNAGVDLPYDCRSGHCGTCCVRVVSGQVLGGQGAEPGVVHACQCRVVGDVVVEKVQSSNIHTIEGVLTSLRELSPEVVEVGITPDRALPHHAGQYVQVRFKGYPSRPFSITHTLAGHDDKRTLWFHIRRMTGGLVTEALGKRIKPNHRVTLTGPYGSAQFRPNLKGRLILVATNTGFAPIWSIAVAALRERPDRRMLIIVGGRSIETLYMGSALAQLMRFPNVRIVPVCSRPQTVTNLVYPGRPTDYLPHLMSTDVLYTCGAPGMVASVKLIAAQVGAVCYADPFLTIAERTPENGVLGRAKSWLSKPRKHQTKPPTNHKHNAYQALQDH